MPAQKDTKGKAMPEFTDEQKRIARIAMLAVWEGGLWNQRALFDYGADAAPDGWGCPVSPRRLGRVPFKVGNGDRACFMGLAAFYAAPEGTEIQWGHRLYLPDGTSTNVYDFACEALGLDPRACDEIYDLPGGGRGDSWDLLAREGFSAGRIAAGLRTVGLLDGKSSENGLDVPPPPDVHPDPEPGEITPLLEQGEPEEPE